MLFHVGGYCVSDLQLTNKTLNRHACTHARTHTGTQEGNSHLYANIIVSLTVSFWDRKCACENSFSHGREVHKHDREINVACALCSHRTNGSWIFRHSDVCWKVYSDHTKTLQVEVQWHKAQVVMCLPPTRNRMEGSLMIKDPITLRTNVTLSDLVKLVGKYTSSKEVSHFASETLSNLYY